MSFLVSVAPGALPSSSFSIGREVLHRAPVYGHILPSLIACRIYIWASSLSRRDLCPFRTFCLKISRYSASLISISEAIKEIESTYGITAFNRHSRGIQLTRDGDELLVELMRIQHHLEYLDERYSMRQKRQDVLSVATQHHICGLDSFAAFLSESQEDTYWMEFLECSTPKVLSEVENNAADIGIVFFNAEAEKQMLRELKSRHLEFHLICGGQAHAYFSENHPLACQQDVSMEELSSYPFISYDRKSGVNNVYTDVVLFSQYRKVVTVGDRATAQAMMQGSNAFTIGSGFRSLLDPSQVLCKPIRDGNQIKIGWLSSERVILSDNAKRYVDLLQQEIYSGR